MSSLMVAAIDFGTTYSGWAFSFKYDFERDPTKVSAKNWSADQLVSPKAPTCVLIKPDGKTFDSFGYEAETKYSDMTAEEKKHEPWYFFRRFKMMLFNKMKIERKVMLEDETGKKLPAILVFSLVIRYLKDDLLQECHKQLADTLNDSDIKWVLTVPAIWNDAAKQFMREAAEKAGIKREQLSIALEPEAASLYCRHIPVQKGHGESGSLASLKPGTKYIVIDAGGGTVDVTVHQVVIDDKLREIHRASGGAWGGTEVDKEYERFLVAITGPGAMDAFKRQHMDDYIDLFRTFEVKKREISASRSEKVTFRLPPSLTDIVLQVTKNSIEKVILNSEFRDQVTFLSGKLRVEANTVKSFFKRSVESIISHILSLLQDRSSHDCSVILMVGGFSECKFLHDAIRKTFPAVTIIIPDNAGLAVLKGAVIYGHKPSTIAERICKFTYGVATTHTSGPYCRHPMCRTTTVQDGTLRCLDIFCRHITIGQIVKLGEEQKEYVYYPFEADHTAITFLLYASTSTNPIFVTEPGCTQVGYMKIKIPDTSLGMKRAFGTKFMFGGTEIAVKIEDKATGEMYITSVDFLE